MENEKKDYRLVRDKTLESMYNLRLSLVSLKLLGQQFIKKVKFKEMLEEEKNRIKTKEVSDAIDKLFDSIFKDKEVTSDISYTDEATKKKNELMLKLQQSNAAQE